MQLLLKITAYDISDHCRTLLKLFRKAQSGVQHFLFLEQSGLPPGHLWKKQQQKIVLSVISILTMQSKKR